MYHCSDRQCDNMIDLVVLAECSHILITNFDFKLSSELVYMIRCKRFVLLNLLSVYIL